MADLLASYQCECSVSEPVDIPAETIRRVLAINSPKLPNVVGKIRLDFQGDHVEVTTIGDHSALSLRWYFYRSRDPKFTDVERGILRDIATCMQLDSVEHMQIH